MRSCSAGLVAFLLSLILYAGAALPQSAPRIETHQDSDYFGFDLRVKQDTSLDQCKQACLGEAQCKAFTYVEKQRWCFLKTDHGAIKRSTGAIAGQVLTPASDPDIGVPPALAFLPDYLTAEEDRTRQQIGAPAADATRGLNGLREQAQTLLANGDLRGAREAFIAALQLDPSDPVLWTGFARAMAGLEAGPGESSYEFKQAASSAAQIAYRLSRTAPVRAGALAVLAAALDQRSLYRPALEAYKASLALESSAEVQAAYAELRERRGFRVVDHSVDSDSSSPRICIQFSEQLVRTGVDYAPFVSVNGAAARSVEAQGQQVCAEGLEHGKTYRVSLRQGLPSAVGEVLEAPVSLQVYVRDRAPAVRFTGDSYVLPSSGRHGIPLVSVNTASAALQVYRVGDRGVSRLLGERRFLRQLEGYDANRLADEIGEPVWSGTIDIASELNREVTTSVPVGKAVPDRKPGVYVITAVPEGDRRETWEARATQWFVISDVGLSSFAGEDGLSVFVRSLLSAQPLAGADIQLIARNNEILGTATTDQNGQASFAAGLVRGVGGMVPAAILARNGADDFVFLDLTGSGFDLSDRGVTGRAAPGPVDVFSWTERGIYRAGETVHAAALVRDASASALKGLPLTFVFKRPDGVEDRRIVASADSLGGHDVAHDLPPNAMRGTWNVQIHTDIKADPVAVMRFLVEDFVPDRLEFDLAASPEEVAVNEAAPISVDARFLYGAPAAGLGLEGSLRVDPVREWEPFPGYQFGLAEEETQAIVQTLENLPLLDGAGKASIAVAVTNVPATTRLLTGTVAVRVREPGGRAVERTAKLGIAPAGNMIGIRSEAGETVPENSTAAFRVIAVAPDGSRLAMAGLQWRLMRIDRQYQWYRDGNSWRYEPVDITRELLNGSVDAVAGDEARISMPVAWGRYRLEVAEAGGADAVSSVEFDAGWVVDAATLETPDGLEMGLDRETYAAGDTARLTVSARNDGEVLVTVGSDRLLAVHTAHVAKGDNVIEIPVGTDWGAGAYVTATVFRPGEAVESRLPSRAIGVQWLKVDNSSRTLSVLIEAPAEASPRQALDVPLTVGGLAAGEEAYLTLAAVDVGILNLTRYETPDPAGWYHGQRRMGLVVRDLYGRLIDGSLGAEGLVRSGGDEGGMAADGSPPTQKLLALFSGPVRVDEDGKAVVSFDLPQFNGTVRLMAVAWSAASVGSASIDVTVRDPVVVLAAAPKVMAPGDASRLRIDITSTDAPDGEYVLDVTGGDGLSVEQGTLPSIVALKQGERTSVDFPLVAEAAGAGSVTIRLSNDEGLELVQTLAVPVRPARLPVTIRKEVPLAANGGSTLLVDETVLAGSEAGAATVSVDVSRTARLPVASVLTALDRYPYGCTEQTTSRALPMLYLSEFPADPGAEPETAVRERIQQAIDRVLANQSSSGSFGLWSPGYGDLWLDAYVTDFLTRAREKGFQVREEAMLAALENLQNALAYEQNVKDNGSQIAYALYVLARNRRASAGDLRYYADTQINDFANPMARAHLAAALALYGDANRSGTSFASALDLARAQQVNLARSDYGSNLRDAAALLALASETRPLPQSIPAMTDLVSAAAGKQRYFSTQDNAWMLLAARGTRAADETLVLDVNGTEVNGAFTRRLNGQALAAEPLEIANRSAQPAVATVEVLAAPLTAPDASADGFTIERSYYTLEGEEADPAKVVQNTRLVVVLKAELQNDWSARILVSDLLPGGFEIDNPRLVGSADLKAFDWLGEVSAVHSEFRFDRFVAAFDARPGGTREFVAAYVVRAVSPGSFVHPAAVVEDMYRPQFSARTDESRVEVGPAQP
jgi:alpha-2-macroglobulin